MAKLFENLPSVFVGFDLDTLKHTGDKILNFEFLHDRNIKIWCAVDMANYYHLQTGEIYSLNGKISVMSPISNKIYNIALYGVFPWHDESI